jgi:hypothetical protein
MKRVDWVLGIWIVLALVPVMLGLGGFWILLLSTGRYFGMSPAETLVSLRFWRRFYHYSTDSYLVILVAAVPAAILAGALLGLLRARGVKRAPAIVLTIAAWCVIAVAILSAVSGLLFAPLAA